MSIDKIFHIMKKDSKAIFKNPAVVITIIAIIILPSLYALLNIDACWDPYGNTDNLDFAVVNNDQNATYNNASYNFGDKVIDKLEDNDDFAWDFVDEDDARDGTDDEQGVPAEGLDHDDGEQRGEHGTDVVAGHDGGGTGSGSLCLQNHESR